jgi:hypothetical protein
MLVAALEDLPGAPQVALDLAGPLDAGGEHRLLKGVAHLLHRVEHTLPLEVLDGGLQLVRLVDVAARPELTLELAHARDQVGKALAGARFVAGQLLGAAVGSARPILGAEAGRHDERRDEHERDEHDGPTPDSTGRHHLDSSEGTGRDSSLRALSVMLF